jgi:iron complex outermembrane receptor protein
MGPDSPTAFYIGRLEQREHNINADFSIPVAIGLEKPLIVSFGAERRKESYAIEIGDTPSYQVGPFAFQTVQRPDGSTFNVALQIGANGFPGNNPQSATDESRTSYAGYIDIEGDIGNLSFGFAARHENFSDFGSTTNVKAQARYEFSSAFALRGAASTGFRAPTPGQLFTNTIAIGFEGANPIETATLPPTNPASVFFGAVPLEPEKAENFSAGMVFTPSRRLTVTLDAYQINVKDRIGLSGNFDVEIEGNPTATAARRAQLRALGVENFATLGRVRYFTNAFATRTRGADLVINHNVQADIGNFATTFAANYNKTKLTRGGPPVITRERGGDIEQGLPRVRGNISETWTSDKFTVTGRVNYYGKYKSFATPANGGDLTIGDEVSLDLEVGFQPIKAVRLSVGVENLFNEYPDRNFRCAGGRGALVNGVRECTQNFYPFTNATVGGNVYPGDSPLGINGGFWYVRAGVNF